MDRDLCLIVNPSAGAGRAAELLPAVEAELRGLGLRFRVERTTSMEHARELARDAARAGEIAAAMGGDGLTGAVAGELRDGAGVLAVLPGGRGNDFARKLGITADPVAACANIAAGRERRIDLATVDGRSYLGILSAGLDSDANRIANANRLPLGTAVYAYAALRALAAWKPARWTVTIDGESREFDGYSVAVANSGVFGSGMFLVPDAELDDGLLDVVLSEDDPQAPLPRQPAEGLQGHARGRAGPAHAARAQHHLRRRPAVHGLRGRRSDRRAARHRHRRPGHAARAGAVIRLAAGLTAARAVSGLARATGRGGGTSLPGKVLTRMEPHAIEQLAGRLSRGSVVISATNGKTTTAAMVSAVLERTGARLVHNRAGANMVGGVASALAAAARRGGRTVDGDLGLFEVDEFWLAPVVEEIEPRAILLSNLFRDQLDRYGELDTIADRWAELVARTPSRLVLNADDPLVADLGRERGRRSTSASRTTRSRCPSSSTPRTPSTAATAATPTSTRPSTSPTSAATAAPTAAARGPSRPSSPAMWSCAGSAAPRSRSRPAGRRTASSCRCPGSTTSTTRSARRRCASRSRCRSPRSSPAWRPSPPPSAARRRSASAAATRRSCW